MDLLPESPIDVYALGILVAASIVLEAFIDVLRSWSLSYIQNKARIDKKDAHLTAESVTRESLPTDAVI